MSIRSKLLLTLVAAGLSCVAITGEIGYQNGKRSLTQAVMNQLTGVCRSKASQVESYFQTALDQVQALGSDRMVVDAMHEFRAEYLKLNRMPVSPELRQSIEAFYRMNYIPALRRLSPDGVFPNDYLPTAPAAYHLQRKYIVDNPAPQGRRYQLDAPAVEDGYDAVHARYNRSFAKLVKSSGYYDLFLIDGDHIVYSLNKAMDFGTSLVQGPYRSTALARIAAQAMAAPDPDVRILSDFERYSPSLGAPAAFIAVPIVDEGKRIGVLAVQLSIGKIDDIVSGHRGWLHDGLGKSGGSGIVGADHLLRSDARSFIENPEHALVLMRERHVPDAIIERIRAYGTTALQQEVRLPSVEEALAGRSGTIVQPSSSGGDSIVSYMPLNIPGLHWTMASRIDAAEALAPIVQFRNNLLLWGLGLAAVMSLVALALTRAIVRPVRRLATATQRFGAGELSTQVAVTSDDELGQLGTALNRMMHSVRMSIQQRTEENRKLRALLDHSPVGVVIMVDGVVQFANPRFDELVGVKAGDFMPMVYPNPADRELILERLSVDGIVRDQQFEVRRPNGDDRTFLATFSRTEFEGRDGIVGWIVDISTVKRIEREMKSSEERLEAAAQGANLGLWEVDPAKGEILTNEILERQLGYGALGLRESAGKWARLQGGVRGWVELIHPEDRNRVAEMIRQHVAGETNTYKGEHRVRGSDGTYKWILSVGSSFERDAEGRSLRVNGVHIDIGETKALQAELEKARDKAEAGYKRLQELEKLRDNLVHMIVHDMRSPLAVIMGRLELMEMQGEKTLDGHLMPHLNSALKTARALAAMTNDLLDVSRLEEGKFPLKKELCDLVPLAQAVCVELTGLDTTRKIGVEAPGPIEVSCDDSVVRRVLVNLVNNGFKHTPKGTRLRIVLFSDDRRARIEVHDRGPGVPPESRAKIFEKFAASETRRLTKQHSAGLGLAFCRLAIESHGGAIGVEGGTEGGSVFWFELPRGSS